MGELKKKITKKSVVRFLIMNVGTLLLAGGVYFFKAPNNFATGGVSGLSIILNKYITVLSQAQIMLIINIGLLILGFLVLGKGCTFKTAYCSVVYSVEMYLMEFLPIELPLTGQTFLEFCYAMLLTGVGSAIIFNCGGSSGGTDIVALIIKKHSKVNVGVALLVTDFLIAASTFWVFQNVQTGLYSLLGLFCKAFLIDSVIENVGKSKYMTIITPHPERIEQFILEGMHRGYTSYKAQGGYTGEERTVIITVCKRGEAMRLKAKIHSVSPESFVIVTDANEIFGKGFRTTIE